jgi:hypothetical protein
MTQSGRAIQSSLVGEVSRVAAMGISSSEDEAISCQVRGGRRRPALCHQRQSYQFAMDLNMELGVLVRGGELPGQVRLHFERLMGAGALLCVA